MPVFEGETYNDDRVYVLTVSEVTVHCPGKPSRQCWAVTTRRNVRGLPPIREDDFPTREAAEAYKRRMFPTIPLVSLGGHSMTCPCGEAARLAAWGPP
jgi:hypothetical protein